MFGEKRARALTVEPLDTSIPGRSTGQAQLRILAAEP